MTDATIKQQKIRHKKQRKSNKNRKAKKFLKKIKEHLIGAGSSYGTNKDKVKQIRSERLKVG